MRARRRDDGPPDWDARAAAGIGVLAVTVLALAVYGYTFIR